MTSFPRSWFSRGLMRQHSGVGLKLEANNVGLQTSSKQEQCRGFLSEMKQVERDKWACAPSHFQLLKNIFFFFKCSPLCVKCDLAHMSIFQGTKAANGGPMFLERAHLEIAPCSEWSAGTNIQESRFEGGPGVNPPPLHLPPLGR